MALCEGFSYNSNILTCPFGHQDIINKKALSMRIKRKKDKSLCVICNNESRPTMRIKKYGYAFENNTLTCPLGHQTNEVHDTFKARENRCHISNDYSDLCPICKRANYLLKVKRHIESFNYSLVSIIPEDFDDRKTKLEIVCARGHKSTRRYEAIYNYPNCTKCRISVKIGWYDNLKDFGIDVIEKTSINSAKILDGNRIIDMSISQICKRWYLNPFELYKYKHTYVTKDAERSDNIKYQTICSEGHNFSTNIKYLLIGHGCRVCSLNQVNEPESVIGQWIENAGFDIVRRDTDTIGAEIDIYVPDRKIGIEYCGIRWHSLESKKKIYGKERYERLEGHILNKHQEKTILAAKFGIHLITVFESEYLYNRQNTKDIILDALALLPINTNDLRYRKLLLNDKYTKPQPLYFDRSSKEVDEYDNKRYYTVYDCGRTA